MMRARPETVWVVAGLLAGLLLGAPAAASGDRGVQVGVAKRTFSLPQWIPLAGYSRRDGKPARGAHDPVGVRALVLSDSQTTIALVSSDLLMIDERLYDAVRRRLAEQSPHAAITLLLAATHTHSGPGAYGQKYLEKLSMGHFNQAVFDALVEQITETVLQAHARPVPARFTYQRGVTEGLLVNRIEEGGLVDPEVIVCAFYEKGMEEPLAVIVNFAAHPTTLGAWNMRFSADYPGVVMRAVEARWPSSICLFFAAAVGDQGPVKQGENYAATQWLGERLASRVIALLEEAKPSKPKALHAHVEQLALPSAKLRLGWVSLPRWLSGWFVDDDAMLSLAVVGDVAFQGVPCDLTAGLGQQLKDAARARDLKPIVMGFTNDYIGYCIPETLYQTGAYEAFMAFNGPEAGERIVQRHIQMLDQFKVRGER